MRNKEKPYSMVLMLTVLFLSFLTLISSGALASAAQSNSLTITETQITTRGAASNPDIYGNTVVWQDNRNGNWDIYMFDLSTKKETQITTNGSNQTDPVIYGDKIAWLDMRNGENTDEFLWGGQDVYMYSLSTKEETRITDSTFEINPDFPTALDIHDNRIMWGRGSGFTIYDLSTQKETYTDTARSAYFPAFYGNWVVYRNEMSVREGGDMYLYDLSSKKETQIVSNSAYIPAIYGDIIVWLDDRNSDWENWNFKSDVYMYDLSTQKETQITASGSAGDPYIYGDKIVWTDYRNGMGEVYVYDLSTHTEYTTNTSASIQAIYGDMIVWTSWRNGNHDIYVGTFVSSNPPVAAFSASSTSGSAPLNVSFTDKSTGSPTSWNWIFGDGTNSVDKNPVHTYSKAGNYTVSLTVNNEDGNNTQSFEIIVQEAKVFPVANFSANVTSGYAPLAVQFTDLSQNSVGRSWDFNNDWKSDSDEVAPVYVFINPGTYNVNLIASNENGTATKTITIIVQQENSNNQSSNGNIRSSNSSSSPVSSNSSSSSGSSDSGSTSGSSDSGSSSGSSDDSEQQSSGGSHHSSRGSGGGTGGSPEPQSNVAAKDTAKVFIPNDKPVSFNFTNNVTVVDSISFTSEKTVGKTTAVVENLKNKSALVPGLPEGIVYKSFNVWVGNGGYGDSEDILDTVINFKVEKSWIQENDINPSSVVLYKYDGEKKEWVKLPVTLVSESDQFLYFTANVPGYSSFVITGEKGEQSTLVTEPIAKVKSVNVKDNASNVASIVASKIAENNEKAPGFGIVSGIVCLICISLYRINKK